jgi:hypothetical protein
MVRLMQSLRKVISALHHEILAALQEGRDLPKGGRLEADKVVVTLALGISQQKHDAPVELWCHSQEQNAASAPCHTITIEFRPVLTLAANGSPQLSHEKPAAQGAGLEAAQERKIAESLTMIFGAPGFDSSARATVFREALAGLSDDQARAIMDSLRGMPTPGITPAAARARHLISRLIDSGNAGSARGRDILAEIFYQHSVQSITRLVRELWKTQEEWLGE